MQNGPVFFHLRKNSTSCRKQYTEEVLEGLSTLQLASIRTPRQSGKKIPHEGLETNAGILNTKLPTFKRLHDESGEWYAEGCHK